MTIRREDLAAAAAVGLLQYRQIDPLLVFLLQRDVCAKRQALQVRTTQGGGFHTFLSYLLAMLAIVVAALFAVLFMVRMAPAMSVGALLSFTALYALAALGIAAWFRRRGYRGRVRLLSAAIVASVPLAVFALQQVGG